MCKNNYINLQNKEVLDLDRVSILPDNAMLKVKHELWIEWDFKKNDDLELNIWKMTKGSEKKAWWICSKCENSIDVKIYSKIVSKKCRFCSGQTVYEKNCLSFTHPELAKQWYPTKNGNLTPNNVTKGYDKKVWWKCNNCGDETFISVNSKKGCAVCKNKKIIRGINDLWTTHPHIASLLENAEDGYKYSFGSTVKVDCKCSTCGSTISNQSINKLNSRGLKCKQCNDGLSFGEKIIYTLLQSLDIYFIHDSTHEWLPSKRYDFYIPNKYNKSLNEDIIIEVHGKQHYKDNTGYHKPLDYEKENDLLKKTKAYENGVTRYIEINAEFSEFEYIKKSILESQLLELINLSNVNWKEIFIQSTTSLLNNVCEMYNNTELTIIDISGEFNISDVTVRRYLTKGNYLNLCEYTPLNERNINSCGIKSKRKVVQIGADMELLKVFNSIKEAGESLNKKHYSSISAVCKGKMNKAYGYKWMYLEEYEKMNNKTS